MADASRPGDVSVLGEETAWRLLRALAAEGLDGRDRLRVEVGRQDSDDGEACLELRRSGDWETSPDPDEKARDLLDLFLPLLLSAEVVVGQLGQSLDGRIATERGHSHYVTGPEDIRRLHRLRALVDAVVVGAGTVRSDDPRLTVREVSGEDPVRVVLDPDGRVGLDRRVFSGRPGRGGRTLLIRKQGGSGFPDPSDGSRGREGDDGGTFEVLALPHDPPHGFDPAAVVRCLRERGLRRILVEGGGVTVSRFLESGVLDRLHVTVAPMIVGSGIPAFTLPPVETLDQALRPPCRHFLLGSDVLFDLDLRAHGLLEDRVPGQEDPSEDHGSRQGRGEDQ